MKTKLFEEYLESIDYKISVFFKELTADINRWFSEGSLGASGCQLVQIDGTERVNAMEKFLMVDFSDSHYYYQLLFIVRVDDMTEENEIEKVNLKVKKYGDISSQNLISELLEEVNIKDIKEDYIIDKISELGDSQEEEDQDFSDNVRKLENE